MRLRVSMRCLMGLVALAGLLAVPIYRYAQVLRQRSRDHADRTVTVDATKKSSQLRADLNRPSPAEEGGARKEAERHERRSAELERAESRPVIVEEPVPPAPAPPVAEKGSGGAPPIVDLTPYAGTMSPEKYQELDRLLRRVGELKERADRRHAERARVREAAEDAARDGLRSLKAVRPSDKAPPLN